MQASEKKPYPTKHRTFLAGLVLLACSPFALAAQQPPKKFAMPVEAMPVTTQDFNVEVSATGSLEANESVVIRPEIIGRITKIHFIEGQQVNKSDILFTLDDAELQARVKENQAALKLSQITFDRAQKLFSKNLISRKEYDEESIRLDMSKARLIVDQERLYKTQLRAPFSGMAGLRRVSPGDVVQVAQELVNLEDISSLKVDFRVPEIYLPNLQTGQEVSVRTDVLPNRVFSGKVYAIAPQLDPSSRSVLVRARIDNADKQLRPGIFARVNLLIEQRKNAKLVPEEALWPIGNQQYVYRVVEGKVVLTPVKTGHRYRNLVEILEGVQSNDKVVTGGQLKIRNGMPVMIINEKPPGK